MEPEQNIETNVDDCAVPEHGVADPTQRAAIEFVDVADLRAITPEQIQLLAATGC